MLSFLHSADWQIGKPYARVEDPDKRAKLRQVRIEAIDRIGVRPGSAGRLSSCRGGSLRLTDPEQQRHQRRLPSPRATALCGAGHPREP